MKNKRIVSTILVLIMMMFILNLRSSKAYSKYAPIKPSYTFGVGENNLKFKMVKVTILVRDVDGTPIEGAQVKAFSEEWGLLYPDWFGYTNSSGMFTFEIPAGNWSFFAGGGWKYAQIHPGEACFMALVNVMVENDSILVLQPDDEFNVTVYNLDDQPIDVLVRLMESSHTPIVVAPDCGRASEGHLRIHVNSGLKYDILLYLDGNGISYVFFKRNIVPGMNMIISASTEDLARLRFELYDTNFNLMPGLYVNINYHEFSVGEHTGLQPVTFYVEGAEEIYVTPSLVGIWCDVNVEGWHYHFPPSDYSLVNGEYRVFRVGGKFTVRVHVLREDTQIWLDVRDSFGNVLINYCHKGEAHIPITLTRNREVIFEGDIAEIVGWWNALVAGKLDRTYSLEDSPHYHITLDLGPFGRFELEGVLLSPETILQYRKIESEHFIINVPNVSSPLLYEKFNKIAEFFEIAYEAERDFIGEWIEGKTNVTFYINYISAGFAYRNTIGMGIGFSIDMPYATVPSTFISVALHELGHVFQLSPPLREYFIEPWFGEPFATLIGHGGLRRIFGRLLELREQGGHNRHFFEYLARKEELNLIENIQFVLFYLDRKYGEEIHRRFVQLWGNETLNKARMTLEKANFNRSEIVVTLYSYIAKENLAWLFKSAGLKVSESRVEEGLRLLGLPKPKPGPMVAGDVAPTVLREGEETTLTFTFVNRGAGEAKNVSARIEAPGFMVVSGIDFSPDVLPRGSGKAVFVLRPLEGGRKTVRVTVTYSDVLGNVYTDVLEINLLVLVRLRVEAKSVGGEPLEIPISIDGKEYVAFEEWIDPTAPVSLRAPEVVEREGTRYVFESWSDGLSTPSREIVLTRSSTVAAVYRVEYYVSVTSPYGETLGSGWYKEGSRATVSVQPTAVGFGIKQIFDRWEDEEGNFVSNSPTLTIVVDRPIELRAVWRTDYTELVLLVMIAGVGVALAIFAKKLSRRPPRLRK